MHTCTAHCAVHTINGFESICAGGSVNLVLYKKPVVYSQQVTKRLFHPEFEMLSSQTCAAVLRIRERKKVFQRYLRAFLTAMLMQAAASYLRSVSLYCVDGQTRSRTRAAYTFLPKSWSSCFLLEAKRQFLKSEAS